MSKYITFDIMIGDRFVHTIAVSILLADRLDRFGRPDFSPGRLGEHIESRLPTLRGKKYHLCRN